ncbi:hypothetical protein BJ944DRAFT_279871, partial [Cunninghamella echinulata]
FSGLCAAIQLKQQLGIKATIFEASDEIGGCWYANTYLGCACDVPSHLYSYSFELNSDWSHHYSPQKEIHEYLLRVTDKYQLKKQIVLNTEVLKATWCEDKYKWKVDFQHKQGPIMTQYFDTVFAGLGPLRIPNIPEQFTKFEGTLIHTANWDANVDFTNKRVGLIGTGASAVQAAPHLQKMANHLYSFQRTATWCGPRSQFQYSKLVQLIFKYLPFVMRIYRYLLFIQHEIFIVNFKDHKSYLTKLVHKFFKKTHAVRLHRAGRPDLIPVLTPNYLPGCKRIVRSENYLETMAKPNVSVVTSGIQDVIGNTIYTQDGQSYELDILVLATGFDVEGFAGNLQVYGKNNLSLVSHWKENYPKIYKATVVSEFPNLYMLLGPGSGLGHNSVISMIECQVDFGVKCIKYMQDNHLSAMDPKEKAQNEYTDRIQEGLKNTVWHSGCESWYKSEDGNIYSLWPYSVIAFWNELRDPVFSNFNYYKKEKRTITPSFSSKNKL